MPLSLIFGYFAHLVIISSPRSRSNGNDIAASLRGTLYAAHFRIKVIVPRAAIKARQSWTRYAPRFMKEAVFSNDRHVGGNVIWQRM
jgi:hypothetical protein